MNLRAARPLIEGFFREPADDRNFVAALRLERKNTAFIFQQHHRFGRGLDRECVMIADLPGSVPVLLPLFQCEDQVQNMPAPLIQQLLVQSAALDGLLEPLRRALAERHLQIDRPFRRLDRVLDSAPVADDGPVIAPFLPDDVPGDPVIAGCFLAIDPVIGAHEADRRSFLNHPLKTSEIDLPERTLTHGNIHAGPA